MTGLSYRAPAGDLAVAKDEFAPDRPLPDEVQRVTVALLDAARRDLRPKDPSKFDAGVHGARKKMKRLRGLLRLVRDEIGYSAYRSENVVLRDTARTIAGMRDARVLQNTLRTVKRTYAGSLAEDAFSTPLGFLEQRYEHAQAVVSRQAITDALVTLGAARSRFATYPIADTVRNDFTSIASGIHRVYRRGFRAHDKALETEDTHDLHDWRKRVKYLRYQMEALRPFQPTLIGAQASLLDDLGEVLGDDHDLAVLSDLLMTEDDACANERERWLLIALIYQQRRELLAQARDLGAAAYAERPADFVDRIGAYWEAGVRWRPLPDSGP